jgi:hypothetical protein
MRFTDDNDVHGSKRRFVMPPNRRNQRMSSPGPKAAGACIALGTIAEYARALDALDARLRRLLPEPVAAECRLADVRNGRVVFLATSSIWASRVRLHQAALLAEARVALGDSIDLFAVKVAPRSPVPPDASRRKPLSATTIRHLRTTATTLSDPEIAALLLNLASVAEDDSP